VGVRGTAVVASAGRKRPATKLAPAGTVLRMVLSERATLALSISRARGSRRTAVGTLVRTSAGPGALAIAFSGRIGRTALAPDTYVATVVAIDGAGNRSRPVRVAFTVVR
jgi:hypothetical protein